MAFSKHLIYLMLLPLVMACSRDDDHYRNEVGFRIQPYRDQVGVDPKTDIRVQFSRDMYAPSVNSYGFTLQDYLGQVDSTVQYETTYRIADLNPTRGLSLLGNYTVSLSGSILDSDSRSIFGFSWSFTTRDGNWLNTEKIESDDLGSATTPQLAVDKKGNTMAVWHQFDGTRNNIWANYYHVDNGWGTAQKIETDDYNEAQSPQLAFDQNGNAIAVWQQIDNGALYYNIWVNYYTAGSGWGSPVKIETDDTGDATKPDIAFDQNGNAIATWQQFDGTRTNIWVNYYTSGSGWGTAEKIEFDDTGNAEIPQIVFDNNGVATVVWRHFDTAAVYYNILANRYSAGSWATAGRIEFDESGDANVPKLAVDQNGYVIAVWHQFDSVRDNIWANRFNGSVWEGAQQIESDNLGSAQNPEVAFDNSGNAIVVWQQFDGSRNNIWSNRYVFNSGWNSAELIETDNLGSATTPHIAVDRLGHATAVWSQFDGVRNNIWSNRYLKDSGWKTAQVIEYDNAGSAINPRVAMEHYTGRVRTIWAQSDGTRDNIWAQRFE